MLTFLCYKLETFAVLNNFHHKIMNTCMLARRRARINIIQFTTD
jgi:hypothetical protein